METRAKLAVLKRVAEALNGGGVTWAVGASLLLYFAGIAEDFRDVDILVDARDVPATKAILAAFSAPQQRTPNERYRTDTFLEYTIDGVDFDVMAGLCIVSEDGRAHAFPLQGADIAARVMLGDTAIPLHSVAAWRTYYALMGRTEKVRMIDEAGRTGGRLPAEGSPHPPFDG